MLGKLVRFREIHDLLRLFAAADAGIAEPFLFLVKGHIAGGGVEFLLDFVLARAFAAPHGLCEAIFDCRAKLLHVVDDVGLFVAELLRLVKERLLNIVQPRLQFVRQIFQRQRHLFAQVAAEHGHDAVFEVARADFQPHRHALHLPVVELVACGDRVAVVELDADAVGLELIVDLGGRVAEELIFGDVTTGASQDIKQATALARAMVTRYGMSDRIGLINYDNDDDEVFIGRDLAHTRSYGEDIACAIDEEVKRMIEEAHQKAHEMIKAHEDVLHSCAALLIEKEKIGRDEFEALFGAKIDQETQEQA